MNLPKIRASFAAIAAAIAYLVVPSTSAAILATNNFETACDGFVADIDGEDASALTAYNEDQPSTTAPYPFSGTGSDGFGSKYLKVDTGDATIFREFDAQTSSTYLDAYMQFEPTSGEISYTNVAKIVVYLDAATSNLCVISGTNEGTRTPVTNRLDTATEGSATVVPGSWGRLTVNAIKTPSDNVFKFNVLLNGNTLSAGGTDAFYSLTDSNAVSRVGFKGTGALDDLVARTSDPFGTAATINGETYATIEQALAESNGRTVTLTENHPGKVYVEGPVTYTIDNSSGYTFGGLAGANGYKVTAGTPDAGVTTYTSTDAFASILPVVVWNGESSDYDFNTLTRTVGPNTYTLNLNSQNTVEGNGSYIQIGPNNSQKAVTLTVQNSNPAVTNGFGTAGAVTVIMKCEGFSTGTSQNRALIALMDGKKYKGGGSAIQDNGAVIGVASAYTYSRLIYKGSVLAGYDVNNTFSSSGEKTVALSYSGTSGTALYVNETRISSATDLTATELASPIGIVLGGVDVDGSSQFYAQAGMKIYAVAVFNGTLTAEQIAAYSFPTQSSRRFAENVTASEVNDVFGSDDEIWLDVADGVTITGDTTFNASTVHFASAGEVVLYPPTDNTANFDFSCVAKPVVAYSGTIPEKNGSVFTSNTIPTWVTDSSQWTGTVWIKNKGDVTNFNLNNYGNALSTIRLSGIKGYFANPSDETQYAVLKFDPTVELDDDGGSYALFVSNGFSYNSNNKYRSVSFSKLKGGGTFVTGDSADTVLVNVRKWDDFSGTLSLTNKIVVFGETNPSPGAVSAGQIWVMTDACVTVPSDKVWYAKNGIQVNGEIRASGLNKFNDKTGITTSDNGKVTFVNSSNVNDSSTDYARITGTGTLKFESDGKYYRAISQVNFPTNMTVEAEVEEGLVMPNTTTNTIGSLSGTKRIRSDWNTGERDLRILQAKDTTWSGTFFSDRIAKVIVAPGVNSAGTLTLEGEQTESNALVVEAGAKVNLTGTWKGEVTVTGELGGTGTITGNVTLSDGATLKVDDMSDTLTISGSLTVGGEVDVYLPAGTVIGNNTKFITSGSTPTVNPGTTFNVYIGDGAKSPFRVAPTEGGLKLYRAPIVFIL